LRALASTSVMMTRMKRQIGGEMRKRMRAKMTTTNVRVARDEPVIFLQIVTG
jgi:hypothetical protein